MRHLTRFFYFFWRWIRSIRTQLTLLFGSLSLLIGALASLYINDFVSARMTETKSESLQRLAQEISISLTENLQERSREVSLLAKTPLLTKEDLHSDTVQENLTRTKQTYRHYAWVGIADTNSVIQAASDRVLVGESVAKRPWFIHGKEKDFFGDVHEAVLLSKLLKASNHGEPLRFVDFASPVYDAQGKLRGVLATHAHWRWVDEVIHMRLPANAKENGIDVFISNVKGAMLSPYEVIGKLNVPPVLLGKNNSQILLWDDQRFLVSSITVKAADGGDIGWRVVVRQPVAKALYQVRELHEQLILMAVVATAILMLLTYWLSDTFSRPVRQLSQQARRIAKGEEEITLSVKTRILELNYLTRSLSAMTSTLLMRKRELLQINDQLEHKVEERTAELKKSNEELAFTAIKLARLARQDALTGLDNRMAADEYLERDYLRMKRSKVLYCVLLLDVDFFKKVNDTHGHDIGDKVLQHVAGVLKSTARASDFIARFGGEEFLIILPDSDREGASILAQKICTAVAASAAPNIGSITVSIGVAVASLLDEDKDAAVRRADQALYGAKQSGRNRVQLS